MCGKSDGNVLKQDYYLSDARRVVPLSEFARVAKAEHRIEECLKRSKSEAGLGEYQVRNWRGWHHHVAVSGHSKPATEGRLENQPF